MDDEVAQLVEMGASRAQARAALAKYRDVMQAAERFFDGEFEGVTDDAPASTPAAGSSSSKAVRKPSVPASDEEDGEGDEDEDEEMEDNGEEDEYVDYDSDAELGTMNLADVDPYAGIFFSKDRREEVIELEEAPEYATAAGGQRIQIMSQGEWMKGCPEGGEQSFLFGLYHQLAEGACPCPCGQHALPRTKSDFFGLYPDFPAYTEHLLAILERQCPRCAKTFCFACGEALSEKRAAGADPLFHCPELQGVLIGVGLSMVEHMVAAQAGAGDADPDDAAAAAPVSNKRRNAADDGAKKARVKTSVAPGGTGYAGAAQEDLSGQMKAAAAQKHKDGQLGSLLAAVRTHLPDLKREGGLRPSDHNVHPTTLAHLRRRLCPVVSGYLRNDSLTDMEERSVLYFELFEWLKTVANHESFASMMAQPVMLPASVCVTTKKGSPVREKKIVYEGSSSPRELLESIVIQATAALKSLRPPEVVTAEMTEDEKRTTEARAEEEQALSSENVRLRDFCESVLDTTGVIDRFLRDTKGAAFFERMQASLPRIVAVSSADVRLAAGASAQDAEKVYCDWASRARFEYGDLTIPTPEGGSDSTTHFKHFFSNEARLVAGADMPRRSLSIAKELAVLTTNLPVAWGSSIFVRVDETRVDVIKALITGPEGTPYHNGCYLFDIFLGADYNRSPPRVKYMTTNGGKFRFNPNLYADGKVCLSLLGTWQGPAWISGKSTLLQVLISIQAMILCEEPYLNEPGWAESAGTPQSKAYSANVRRMVVHTAMLDALRNPPEPFGDVIRTHFRLKASSVSAQLDAWKSEDDSRGTSGDGAEAAAEVMPGRNATARTGSTFAKDIEAMKQLLAKLQKGEALN